MSWETCNLALERTSPSAYVCTSVKRVIWKLKKSNNNKKAVLHSCEMGEREQTSFVEIKRYEVHLKLNVQKHFCLTSTKPSSKINWLN